MNDNRELIHCEFSTLGCHVELSQNEMDHHIATSEEHSTEFLLQLVMKLTVLMSDVLVCLIMTGRRLFTSAASSLVGSLTSYEICL